jgi:DNA-binding FadR family transcriptional regulator
MNSLSRSIHEMIDAAWPGAHDLNSSYSVHEAVFRAVRRKSERQATRAMARHMEMMTGELRRARLIE